MIRSIPAPSRVPRDIPKYLGRRNLRGAIVAVALLSCLSWGVSACGGSEPEGPSPEEQAKAQAEAEAKAEQERQAAEALAAAPEPEPPPEPEAPPEPPPPPPVSEETIPEFKYLEEVEGAPPAGPSEQLAMVAPGPRGMAQPGQINVAVLYGPGQEQAAVGVATVIDTWRKDQLAEALGMPVKVAFLSRGDGGTNRENIIRYRPGALKAALQIAAVLPADQSLEPMSPEEEARASVDIVIHVGSAVR